MFDVCKIRDKSQHMPKTKSRSKHVQTIKRRAFYRKILRYSGTEIGNTLALYFMASNYPKKFEIDDLVKRIEAKRNDPSKNYWCYAFQAFDKTIEILTSKLLL